MYSDYPTVVAGGEGVRWAGSGGGILCAGLAGLRGSVTVRARLLPVLCCWPGGGG